MTPRTQVYEDLKELRRRGELLDGTDDPHDSFEILTGTEATRPKIVQQISERFRTNSAAESIRILDVRALADRVFGDEKKADAWLNRPNKHLSGQKPLDLLKDELGAAVVREALEQIDSGIFA